LNHPVLSLLNDLDRLADEAADADGQPSADSRESTAWLQSATAEQVSLLLDGLLDRPPPQNAAVDGLLAAAFQQLMLRRHSRQQPTWYLDERLVVLVAAVYRHLQPASGARELLPLLLGGVRSPRALVELADLLVDDPPADPTLAAAALSPLFQHDDYDPGLLFPRLLGALVHASVAACVLDLANFLTRRHRLARHPAADHAPMLASLLGGVVGRLGQLESSPPHNSQEIQQRSHQIGEGVSLAVSLCDALALIGDRSVTGKLYQASELSHRRLRAEAVGALARLGERRGRDLLVRLAAEPVVRLRVLAYAEELGLLDQVDPQYQTDRARAEAELVLWLAQPAQVGVPPVGCEWVESRCLYWPGFEEPVDCHLFRFTYVFGDAQYTNVGIAGPACYAFGCDLSGLPVDDLFAAFAGWHAEHDEMYEFPVSELHEAEHAEVARLARRLHDEGYQQIQPHKLCLFFGDRVLVAEAVQEGQAGMAVADYVQTTWIPRTESSRPPGPDEAYCIYKGRRLLGSFNE
jgi:hypothetical protein